MLQVFWKRDAILSSARFLSLPLSFPSTLTPSSIPKGRKSPWIGFDWNHYFLSIQCFIPKAQLRTIKITHISNTHSCCRGSLPSQRRVSMLDWWWLIEKCRFICAEGRKESLREERKASLSSSQNCRCLHFLTSSTSPTPTPLPSHL